MVGKSRNIVPFYHIREKLLSLTLRGQWAMIKWENEEWNCKGKEKSTEKFPRAVEEISSAIQLRKLLWKAIGDQLGYDSTIKGYWKRKLWFLPDSTSENERFNISCLVFIFFFSFNYNDFFKESYVMGGHPSYMERMEQSSFVWIISVIYLDNIIK